jgi:SnoaL-like domain
MTHHEHPNVTVVREGFEALERGDTAWMDQHLADDVIWHVGGNSKWAGTYQGKAKVLEYFGRQAQATETTAEIHDILGNDEHVAAAVQSDAWVGCMVWSTAPRSSTAKLSRSTWSRSRAPNASIIRVASWPSQGSCPGPLLISAMGAGSRPGWPPPAVGRLRLSEPLPRSGFLAPRSSSSRACHGPSAARWPGRHAGPSRSSVADQGSTTTVQV